MQLSRPFACVPPALLRTPVHAWLHWGAPSGSLYTPARIAELTGAPADVVARLPLPPAPTRDAAGGGLREEDREWHVPSAPGKALALTVLRQLLLPAMARVQTLLQAAATGTGAATPTAAAAAPFTAATAEGLRRDLATLHAAIRGSATSLCDRRVGGATPAG